MISKGGFAHLEGQKAPKTEPGRVPNRAPEATPAEKGKSTKLGGRLTKFFDFYGPGTSFWEQKRDQNGVPIAAWTLKVLGRPLESLLERSWTLLEPI